ncbi:MAG: threonylcarbamoyl-AMP synthase [Deltaproteobacteria bacterium]|nr:threonylcarbamoyl-AMP synthase [Deltaproteobacteria bacterium]
MSSLSPVWLVVDSQNIRRNRPPWAQTVDFHEAIDIAEKAINLGKIVVFPTETFYGLAVDASNTDAIERLVINKGREAAKALALIAGTNEQVERWAEIPHTLALLAKKYWPGPLTLALPPKQDLPTALYSQNGTIGMRISSHPFAQQLAIKTGIITATSANITGEAPIKDASDLSPILSNTVDIVIDMGICFGGEPSTVVGLNDKGSIIVFREGAISRSDLKEVVGYYPHLASRRNG